VSSVMARFAFCGSWWQVRRRIARTLRRTRGERSVQALVDDFGGLLRREGLVLHVDDALRDRSGESVLDQLRGELAEERVALDDEVDLPVDEGEHAVLHRVD